MALLRVKDYLALGLSIVCICLFVYTNILKSKIESLSAKLANKELQITSLSASIDKQNAQIQALKLDLARYSKPALKQAKINQIKEDDELKAYKAIFDVLGQR